MASTARIDELKKKFDENPRRYFAPLANEFRKSGDIEQAIIICEEFLPQQPGHMSGHIVYGQALYEAGRLPESRTVFETALGLDPENLIALRHLGDIAHGQGDLEAARSWYTRVLDADPRNEEIQALIASLPAPTSAHDDIVQIIAEEDFDLVTPLLTPATEVAALGLPLDIEKEEPSLEAAPTDLQDTHPFGVPAIPSTPTPPPVPETELIEGFSLHGFEASPERDTEVVAAHAPAEGLESTAFTPPEEPIATVVDLDDSLESGVPSFESPPEVIAAIAGLQDSAGTEQTEYEDVDTEKFAAAQRPILDDDFVLPSTNDAVAEPAAVADAPEVALASAGEELLDFDMDGPDAIVEPETVPEPEPVQVVAEEVAIQEVAAQDAAADEAPMELSASVLAAESELIDAGETPEPEPSADVEVEMEVEEPVEAAVTQVAPFDTETMAELYVAQGLTGKARGVYERLLAANPGDARLQALVASLVDVPQVHQAGPTVREFFARMAARRPGERSAAAAPPAFDDFAEISSFSEPLAAPLEEEVAAEAPSDEPVFVSFVEDAAPVPEPELVEEFEAQIEAESEEFSVPARPTPSSSDVAPAIERAAAMRTPAGSIDALFNNRNPGTSEDSAASALAQAFGATAEAEPLIVGRPARAASAELSLDSVFRDGPPRPPRNSQSFSFDQFFTAGAVNAGTEDRPASETPTSSSEVPEPGEPPAERSADDIQQFNSWLQGLKPR